ncbi:tetratricopeptide repeat protein [Actinokineospora auranticolor]|nr:tetratricopeptide repeat protein [Actinokineospora auranticolor]
MSVVPPPTGEPNRDPVGGHPTDYPTHQTIVTFDVEGYSAPHRDDRARAVVRATAYRVVEQAFLAAGVPWGICFLENTGDGAIVIVPPQVSKVLLLDPMPGCLLAALAEHNRGAELGHRVRMRLAVHAGEVSEDEHGRSGDDLVHACRLLDSADLRTALAHAGVPLAVIVSDAIYDGIVRHRYRGIDPTTYHPVSARIKNGRAHGWIHLPGTTEIPVTGAPAAPEPSTSDSPTPRQLLPAPASFVCRETEIDALDAASREHRLLMVVGPPGVGKTALGLRWAHRVRERFDGGQLYADLGGPHDEVSPQDVLGRFLRALGVAAAKVPVDLAEQAALFRSLTARARLLVVLDNAVTTAQVRYLLPASPDAVTLVTSRSRLGGLVAHGARTVELAPLSTADGTALLGRLVGPARVAAEPDWARRLAALCAGLPIALCVVGARLATRVRCSLERAVRDLLDERRRLARLTFGPDLSVEVVFAMSYQALSAPAARLYRLVGLHPGADFTLGVAAAAVGDSPGHAQAWLDELMEANLVDEPLADRYRFHDLIRLHAADRARAEEGERASAAAVRRMADWYLHSAAAATAKTTPHRTGFHVDVAQEPVDPTEFTGHGDALDWLDTERTNLLAVAGEAMDRGWAPTTWQIADAMWGLFLYRQHYGDWLRFDTLAIQAAQSAADRAAEALASDRVALLHHALRRNDEALTHMARARSWWQESGDRHRAAGSLERFGFVYLDQGEVELALRHFRGALAGYRELDQSRSVGLALISVGRALLAADRPGEAAGYLREAVTTLGTLAVPDEYNRPRALIALGRAETALGDVDEAGERLRAALAAMESADSPLGQADAYFALGELHERLGNRVEARRHYERTAALFDDLGNPGANEVRERVRAL